MFRKIICSLILALTALIAAVPPVHADGPLTLGRGSLTAIALSPDGARLAVGTSIAVYLFDAQSFAVQQSWASSLPAQQIIWSPNGSQLLVIGARQAQAFAADGTLQWSGPACGACEWAFSRDGATVAEIADFTRLRLFEAGTGRLVQALELGDFFSAIAWHLEHLTLPDRQSANGRRLALGQPGYYSGADALVYDVAGRFAFNHTHAYGAALSPDGGWLAAGAYDGTLRLYRVGDKEPELTWPGLPDGYTRAQLTWAPDSQTLYGAAHNRVVAWEARTGAVLRVLDGFTAGVGQIAWSADGRRVIATQGHHLGSWDLASRQPDELGLLNEYANSGWSVTEMAVSPSGSLLAVADWAGVTVHAADTLQALHRLVIGRRIMALAFSPDGRWLATAGDGPFVNVWDTATGRPVMDLASGSGTWFVSALAFLPDGKALLGLESTGRLRRWDLAGGASTAVQTYQPPNVYYYDPAIHPGAQRVAAEYGWQGVVVSDLATGARQYQLAVRNARSIQINAAGTRLAASVGGQAQIWDLATGALLASYGQWPDAWRDPADLAFSPDGTQLAVSSTGGYVQVWPVP
ncbi:MAG: PD40 domain-containing protein [Anaerolineales bacterium]|nr:PD40 domain-containing protein [Anaerolineales bacterium]